MLVQATQTIKDYEGEPVKEERVESNGSVTQVEVTLRRMIWQALNTPESPNAPWNPDEKMRNFELTLKVHTNDPVQLDESDRTYIIEHSKKVNPPLAHGRLVQMLTDPLEGTGLEDNMGEGDREGEDTPGDE